MFKFCPHCGSSLDGEHSVCAACGASLANDGAQSAAEPEIIESLPELSRREGEAVSSAIERVTVFIDAAEITRSASVRCEAGKSVFRLTPLSRFVRADSLVVTAEGAAVLNAKYDIDPLADAPNAAEREKLIAAYNAARADVKRLDDEIAALEDAYAVLTGECASCADKPRTADEIRQTTRLFADEAKRIKQEQRALALERDDSEKEKKRLEAALRGDTETDGAAGVITVELFSKEGGEAAIKVKYTDESASWQPRYEARANPDADKCRLMLRGAVAQFTGEDWSDISLSLATGVVVRGGSCPKLTPMRLGVPSPTRGLGMPSMKMRSMMYSVSEEADEEETLSVSDMSDMVNFYDAQARRGALNVEYELPARHTVKSGEEYTADVTSSELTTEYKYKTAPKLREAVYLTGELEGWREACPLEGTASAFLGSTFVGETPVDPQADDEKIVLSLGVCADIDIKRSPEKRFTHKTDLLGRAKYDVEWTITARSRRAETTALTVLDQIPISANAQIEITALELSGAERDENTGELRWQLELKPDESKPLSVKYSVSYPKKITPQRV